jgi:hypothetical protein
MSKNTTFWRTKAVAIALQGLCLTLSGAASAAALFTSMLDIQTANPNPRRVNCQILNVSSSNRSGTIRTIRGNGTVLSVVSYNIAPGRGAGDSVSVTDTSVPYVLVYCHFTVKPLPGETATVTAGAVRASLVLIDPNGNAFANAEAR